MVLLITGATGGLGRKILDSLVSLGLPAGSFACSTSSLTRLPVDLKASVRLRLLPSLPLFALSKQSH
jgi:NADP-dependent 3-hydroxy acid dehydrogenase YdfG